MNNKMVPGNPGKIRDKQQISGPYDDIIRHPHHEPIHHPRMALRDRAAQFSPFAALVGYEDSIDETARLTEEQWNSPAPDLQDMEDMTENRTE